MDLWSRVGLKINCHNQNNMFFGEDNKLKQLYYHDLAIGFLYIIILHMKW